MTRRLVLVLGLAAIAIAATAAAQESRDHKEAVKHYRAGQKALGTERWAEAEEEFRIATQLDPLLVAAHYGLGQTYMATKRYPDAVRAYSRARDAFHQQQAESLTDRLAFQKRIDDQIKALESDIRAAQRQVSGPGAELIQRAIGRNEEQIRTLEALRRRDVSEPLPTPHWLSLALGSAHFRNGAFADAEREYKAALAVKPDLGEAHNNLAVVYMLTERLDEAQAEVALAEKSGFQVPPGLKQDIVKRRGSRAPKP